MNNADLCDDLRRSQTAAGRRAAELIEQLQNEARAYECTVEAREDQVKALRDTLKRISAIAVDPATLPSHP
jgi:hypothetical protein